MKQSYEKMLAGYKQFREKYALGDRATMQHLAHEGQHPETMVVSCCDSRVDPALLLQCDPGDLFVVRNIANIVPSYQKNGSHQGTSAALEFGICHLKIKHLILLGHSQCGGIQALVNNDQNNDFIKNWVSLIKLPTQITDTNEAAKLALHASAKNCLSYPWINDAINQQKLSIHLWFFDIQSGQIITFSEAQKKYTPLT